MIREREYNGLPGIPVLLTLLLANSLLIWALVTVARARHPGAIVLVAIALSVAVFLMFGHFMVNPN